jgi:hypothetical protein
MKKRLMFLAAFVAAALSVSLAAGSSFAASPVYNAVPTSLPPNVASVGYEATSTSEFGDYVHLTNVNANRVLNAVTVTMSDWALYSDYSSDLRYSGNTATWSHPITVNLYSNHLGTNGAPDTLLATKTQNVTIPWRPASAGCTDTTAWKGSDGNCYHGLAFNATFDLSSLDVTLPNNVIVGVAYNTADYGLAPIGVAGPYNSLNVGTPNGQTASIGTDDSADHVFWNTSYAPFYADGGTGGVGTFRQDTNWTPNGTVAFQITTSATCTPTGLMRDGINLTAAVINPTSTVTGMVDASPCNIGVYYGPTHSGTVSAANISGANYYGVVANAAHVDVTNTSIHNIGESPFNGTQHGVGVLYTTIDQAGNTTGTSASGILSGSTISLYQKNGVVVSGTKAGVTVKNNHVTGNGPVNYIAQNGIQISFGATASLTGNSVSGHFYTPATVTACGLLFYQAGGVKQSANTLFANQTNLCNAGRGGGGFNP